MKGRPGRKKQLAQGKISARLLEFAEPMVEQAYGDFGEPTADQLKGLLMTAAAIWNAKVMEQIGRGTSFVEEIERVLLQAPDLPTQVKDLTRLMLQRKTTHYPNDLRFIGHFDVYTAPNGELRVKAEAHLVSELSREH